MANDFFAKVEGGEELKRALRSMPERVMNELSPLLYEFGRDVTSAGAATAPIDKGELRGSSMMKVKIRQQKKSYTFLGFLMSSHAAAVHEGVFGGVKKQLASFKWWARLFQKREGQMMQRVEMKLRSFFGGDQ